MSPTISAIVPTLTEQERLPILLDSLRAGGCHEIIVVDGGSEDATVSAALPVADRVIVEGGGLAAQLNAGVAIATGEVFFFPYADTLLPAGWRDILVRTLAPPAVVAGAFRLAFEDPRWRYRVIAGGANLRARLGLGPLGDQALFVQRRAYERVGGHHVEPLLEDLDLVQRLRRIGRLAIAPIPVRTSTRRWQRGGLLATTLRHWQVLGCHQLGLRSQALRQRYLRQRRER